MEKKKETEKRILFYLIFLKRWGSRKIGEGQNEKERGRDNFNQASCPVQSPTKTQGSI